ncbi:NAD(P)-binding protein [Macrolepiota fuliginosa MF-IS2]|uniref:NAD(P)-binding protein n=1 Tax=Macrolepiota fuliginosa MF-IS2 TaxID=1400762 RepID=A0A9P6BXB1_9AGAR|nr:NAD(P)-binding protein [Macrolepiota fuliginosa MF-IS2]
MWPFNKQRHISEEDLGDLHGKVTIITGGYSGIGYSTTQFLVRKGARVYLATRNEQGTKEAIERLEKEGIGEGSLHWLKLDLEDPRSAKNSAEEFLKKEDRLDILATVGLTEVPARAFGPFNMTKDGLRDSMAINYLGHLVFTENLLPLLIQTSKQEGSDVRIIGVSSRAHTMIAPTSFVGKDNFNKSYGTSVVSDLHTYGLSKLANIQYTKRLQRRLDAQDAPIICISIHPGVVMTPSISNFLANRGPVVKQILSFLVSITFVSARQGAMNSAYAAASPEVRAKAETFKGVYLEPIGQVVKPSPQAEDERLGNELHDTTLEVLKELGL